MTTHTFHPTFVLTLIVTTSLVAAYGTAALVNHQLLWPRCAATGRTIRYFVELIVLMIALTAFALLIIRISYHNIWGPDADPYGTIKHFAIDLFGMTVHVAASALVFSVVRRRSSGRDGD